MWYMQAIITLPVVVWLILVQPITLRTMHDDEEDAGSEASPSIHGLPDVSQSGNQAWSKLSSAAVVPRIVKMSMAIMLPTVLPSFFLGLQRRFGRALAGQHCSSPCSGGQFLMGGPLYNMPSPCVPAELPGLLSSPGGLWRLLLLWPSGEEGTHWDSAYSRMLLVCVPELVIR